MTDRDDVLGRRIASRLDGGLTAIDAESLDRLREFREGALDRQRTAPGFAWAWAGTIGQMVPGLRNLNTRHVLTIGILLLSLVAAGYWQTQNQNIDELADVDAGLLAGDLPIDAYLDKGLDSWLTRSPQ
jgi:hypothetical protein